MNGRLLPVAEWSRLKGTEMENAWQVLSPEHTQIWVVEDEGEIVATWATYPVLQAHGFWIREGYRGRFGVAKRLMLGMRQMAERWGVREVLTGSMSEHVSSLLKKWRGSRVPGEQWLLPVETIKSERMRDREVGESFHRQCEALLPGQVHEDDPEHNEHVGHAFRMAFEGGKPEKAAEEYNLIAGKLGYDTVTYLGVTDSYMRAESGGVVFEMNPQYEVRILEVGR
jgi:N-acetylglutamate synthase-like GNAT family acetyltransferase